MKNKKSLKLIVALLSVALIFSSVGLPVFATDTGMTRPEDATVEDSVEENLELGEEQVEEMPLTQVMSQKETQLPEAEAESIVGQKDWKAYDPVSASISNLQILERESNESEVTIGISETVTFTLPTTLGGSAKTVWIGYRFTLPQSSPSGGKYSFVEGTYSWLQHLEGQGQAKVRTENGNLILEGKVQAENADGNIAPGVFSPSISVNVKNLVNGETAKLEGECWIIDSVALPKKATATMTSKGESMYIPYNDLSEIPRVSGYFNQVTGDFSVRKPENPKGYVYGRVYSSRPLMWNDGSSERVDPTKPITYNLEWKLFKKEKGVETEVEDPAQKPILMAMKKGDPEVKESELEGLPVNDFTLGGLITDGSKSNGPQNQELYRKGDYTFSRVGENKVKVSAVLSKDNKNSGFKDVASYALFFVPMTEVSSGESNKDPEYWFETEVTNLQGTSYSDQPIKVVSPEKGKKRSFVRLKANGEGLLTTGLFSRATEFVNGVKTVKKNSNITANVLVGNTKESTITDYEIHSINMLIKFQDGLSLKKIEKPANKNYSGKVNLLYGIKKDKTPWADDIEMNHTQDYQLVYYDDLETAEQMGTIVAVLVEFRDGVWVAGRELRVKPEFVATGGNGSSQVIIQDVKIWRGTADKIDSWAGTNGEPVVQNVDPTDIMVPYDNPDNTEGNLDTTRVYRRDKWLLGDLAPTLIDNHTFGDTVHIVGGIIQRPTWDNPTYPSKNLNGTSNGKLHGPVNSDWSSSTFDTSVGQRVVDRVYSFEVKDVEQQELSLKIVLDKPYYKDGFPEYYLNRVGKAYLSTKDNPVTYVPNERDAKRGTFKGGIEIDPENFTVPGDGVYQIYYSTFLGSETDLSKDVPADVLWGGTHLEPIGETPKFAVVNKDNTLAAYATVIVKNAATSISKASASEGTRKKAEYNLMIHEYNGRSENTFIMDILPYNGDDAGSSFHGRYKIDQDKIDVTYQSAKGEAKSIMKLFYTTNENIRNRKDGKRVEADIFSNLMVSELKSGFKAGEVIWQEAVANDDSTSFAIPKGVTPTAIVLAGNVEEDERVTAKISLALEDQKVGDKYNNISSTKLGILEAIPSEIASVTVIGRNVAGTAWQDKNKNGIFEEGDVILEGVKVRLYNADHTEITQDANNISYGEVITGKDGSYKFENVPENQEGYYVEFEGTDKVSINDYQTVEQYKSGAKSPFEKDDDSDVIFQDGFATKVNTGIFKLKLDKDLLTNGEVQNADGINAGFEKALVMKAEKIWNGRADSENSVKIQLQRRANADVPWEEVADDILSESDSWETTFDKQPVLYNNNGVERYEYRVVELDGENKPVENGTIISLNENYYQVKADKLSDDSWKITNNRIVDLTIKNQVLGEFGDRTKKFLIVINARDSEGHPISGTFDCEGLDGVNTIEFQNGVANVQLAHDEQIVIKNVAHSTSFDISVEAESGKGYTVKYTRDDGAESDNASFSIESDSVVKVLNTKTDIPETGISNDSNDKGIFIVLGVLGIAMLGLSVLRKRKGLR